MIPVSEILLSFMRFPEESKGEKGKDEENWDTNLDARRGNARNENR